MRTPDEVAAMLRLKALGWGGFNEAEARAPRMRWIPYAPAVWLPQLQ